MLEELAQLVETRFWAHVQQEVQEAIRTFDFSELALVGVNPLVDLAPSARAELHRLVDRMETGEANEAEEISIALGDLARAIRPAEFELMLEGYVPMSEAAFLCRELETLLDPASSLLPTPSELRAAAAVSWPRLWAEFVEEKRGELAEKQRSPSGD